MEHSYQLRNALYELSMSFVKVDPYLRTNPIGLSFVRLVGRQKNILEILDIDVLNDTPLIDIKPYVPGFDAKTENVRSGWLEENQVKAKTMTSDRRFI